MGLATWLRRRAERDGNRPALTFAGETMSFAALQHEVEAVADVLAACGIVPGDRVAYVGDNHSRFLVALFATARIGAIFVPLNFRCTGHELAHNIQDSDARLLIADEAHTAPVDEVRAGLDVQRWLRLGASVDGWDSLDDLLAQRPPHMPEVDVDPDAPALIL